MAKTSTLPSHRRISLPVQLFSYTVLIAGAIVMLMPFIWMVSTACKPPIELNKIPVSWLPKNPVCRENLESLYDTSKNFNRYLFNSALVTIGRTLGQLVTCSLAAYGFARYSFPGKNVIFALCLALLMIPFQAILIPEFRLIRELGWFDTFNALIIPGMFSAFALFLLRQAFLQIPLEIEEAAIIDGANPLQVLLHVTLPLSIPSLAAFAVITMQAAWNDFLYPLVVSSTPKTRVATIGVALLQGERRTPWNLLMMGSLLTTLPILILFILLQRYFIAGISSGGVKQ